MPKRPNIELRLLRLEKAVYRLYDTVFPGTDEWIEPTIVEEPNQFCNECGVEWEKGIPACYCDEPR